jgi:hypothetical protein
MIMIAGLRVVARYALSQQDCPDFAVLDQALQVPIYGREANSRQFFANPTVDLIGEGMGRIPLESLEDSL